MKFTWWYYGLWHRVVDHEKLKITGPHNDNSSWGGWQYSGRKVMDHFPYSTDLAPSIFHAFGGPLKELGCQAICNRRRHEASCHFLPAGTWHRLLLYWGTSFDSAWDKWLNVRGDYWQVWCVPSATYVSHVRWRHKVHSITSEKNSWLWNVSYAIFWLPCSSWWPWNILKSATEEI